jgi:hypothetical protein
MRLTGLLLICGASFFSSCLFEKSDAPSIDPCSSITYSKNVVPIINTHCAINACHVAGFAQGDFTSYDILFSKVENGSFQLRVFELRIMPPNDSLNDEELATLQCWINNGALND